MVSVSTSNEPRVLVCLYDLALWLMKHTNRFPKNWRVTLGDRLDRLLVDMLSLGQRAILRCWNGVKIPAIYPVHPLHQCLKKY